MTALDWVRSKAEQYADETFEAEGVTYRVRRYSFRGTVPYRMAKELRKAASQLVVTDLEAEYLSFAGQYRSQFGQCEYSRNVYEVAS